MVLLLRVERHQLLRILIRQRLQKHGAGDSEDGRVAADAQGEGEDRCQAEAGILAQHAQTEKKVLQEGMHGVIISLRFSRQVSDHDGRIWSLRKTWFMENPETPCTRKP